LWWDTLGCQRCYKVEEGDVLKRQEENLGKERCGKDVGWKQSEGRLAPSNMLEV
jgi:hypothetical protein